jgi:hypothetical protein
MGREDLHAHIRTNIKDIVQPAKAQLKAMVAVLKSITDADVVAVVTPPAGGRRGRRSKRSAANDSADDPLEPLLPVAPKRKRSRSPSPLASSEDGASVDSGGSPPSVYSDDANTATRARAGGQPATKRQRNVYLACPALCGATALLDRIPPYCSQCGKPWAHASAAPTAAQTPQQWRGRDTFVYTPLSELTQTPLRNIQLAALPDTIIKKAREGQQHYIIADLLCPHAHDGISSTALLDEQSLILLSDGTGGITARTGAAACKGSGIGVQVLSGHSENERA